MNKTTQVRNLQIRQREKVKNPNHEEVCQAVEWTKQETEWGVRILRADRLVRNFAVMGAMLLTIIAVKNAGTPESQSVFAALQASAGMEWDESLGKLSFVTDLLPEAVQEVWREENTLKVLAPVNGQTIHAWSENEPWLLISSSTRDVRAAEDGEVMSIAHGLEEERIMRVRHDDGSEALYGNLEQCYAAEGDRVYAGDVIAQLQEKKALAFELRCDGRSVDPQGKMEPISE